MASSELHAEVAKLRAQLAEAHAALADRDAKIAKLAGDLAALQALVARLLAPRKGGLLVPKEQGLLFPSALNEAMPATAAEESTASGDVADGDDADDQGAGRSAKRSRTPRKIDTAGLPCEDRFHELPAEQRVHPQTGEPLVQIGEKVREELDYRRGRLIVIRHRQAIYGLPPHETEHRELPPVAAELPPQPLENCAASATLLAWLLVQKYANHLPLYRQEQIFGRDGMRLPRQTLCDWALAAAEALAPIADCMMTKIRAGPVMQLDDTPVMCQGGKGEAHFQAYLWTFLNPEVNGVVYRFTTGRASALIAAELGNFSGTLLGDAYSGNQSAADKAGGDIELAGCWSHGTRKFRDATSEAPGTAKLFRADTRRLYAVEHEADAAGLDPDARVALRRQKSRPILAAIFARARRLRDQFSDAGKMAEALSYIRNQRKRLRRFLEDGRIPLDNNACERAIRPIAIGRRNWLFAGSARGGRAAAVIYTLIECCRLANVDMVAYLADVLVRVATHPASRIEELLPQRWAGKASTAQPTCAAT